MDLIFNILKIGQRIKTIHPNPSFHYMIEGTIIDVLTPTTYEVESFDIMDGYEVKLTYVIIEDSKYELIN